VSAGFTGISEFLRPLNYAREETLERWAIRCSKRSSKALDAAMAPDGSPIPDNTPYTKRQKKGLPVGVKSGKMRASLTGPDAIESVNRYKVNILIPARTSDDFVKIAQFLHGRPGPQTIGGHHTMGGLVGARVRGSAIPARDFHGQDTREAEEAGSDALDFIAVDTWGFTKG
jgi:hypothetical protein